MCVDGGGILLGQSDGLLFCSSSGDVASFLLRLSEFVLFCFSGMMFSVVGSFWCFRRVVVLNSSTSGCPSIKIHCMSLIFIIQTVNCHLYVLKLI